MKNFINMKFSNASRFFTYIQKNKKEEYCETQVS